MQKDSLGKSYEMSLIAGNNFFLYLLCIVDGSLGKDQQQHPTVHSGGVSRGGFVAVAVAVSDM